MVAGKLTKTEKKGMFLEPCFSCVLLSLSSLFVAEIFKILKIIRSFYDDKFFPSLSGF
jgi:hypothetical protein